MTRERKRARPKGKAPDAAATLSVGRVLAETFGLTRTSFGPLFALVLVTQGPWLLVEAADLLRSVAEEDRFRYEGVYQIVLGVLLSGAIVSHVHGRLVGEQRSVAACLRHALRRYWSLLGAMIMALLWSALYGLLLVVPGVMKWLSYAVAVPAVMVEERRASDALARSAQLMFGHRGVAFASLLVAYLVASPPALASLLLPRLESAVARAGVSLAEAILALPIDVLAVVLYVKAEHAHREFRRDVLDGD